MARHHQFRLGPTRIQDLPEGDAGITIEHGIRTADQTVAFLQDRRHAKNLDRPFSRSAMRPTSNVKASRKNVSMKCG
jgi:hypothetical protein